MEYEEGSDLHNKYKELKRNSFMYDKITFYNDTTYLVETFGKFDVNDLRSEDIVLGVYTEVVPLDDSYKIFKVKYYNRYGVVNNFGEGLIGAIYTDIELLDGDLVFKCTRNNVHDLIKIKHDKQRSIVADINTFPEEASRFLKLFVNTRD